MKIKIFFLLLICGLATSYDLVLGNPAGKTLIHDGEDWNVAIPFYRRTANYFYNDEKGRKISCIMVQDLKYTQAIADITSGGIGYSYVNIRITSERGRGLHYHVDIYS